MIKMIVAHDLGRIIGDGDRIPWHLKTDFANFKKITSGHTVVMGRKTFESIGRPLPNRKNVVLTRDTNWKKDGVEVIHNPEDVLKYQEDVFILGGEAVYRVFLPHMKKLYVTLVHGNFKGDVKFVREEELPLMQQVYSSGIYEEDGVKFEFLEYEVR